MFEDKNPLMVNWESLCKTVRRMGIQGFIQLGIRSSIEDWKLNDLYSKVRKAYLKGYQTKELVAALDMAVIRDKNKNVLTELEKALGVTKC